MNPLIQSWLLQSLVIFLVVGSLGGIAAGLSLLLRPDSLQRLGQKLDRWISTRHLDQSMENNVNIDPWIYRYRRVGGSLILLGAVYILYYFTVGMERAGAIASLAGYFKLPVSLIGALLDALAFSSILGALCAALVGLFLILRPSMLRDFEQVANRWISLRRAMKPAEIRRAGVDEYVFKCARQAGILLLLGSLYVLVVLLFWIGH